MARSSLQILVVDDFEPWRAFIGSALANESKFQVIAEASDGLMALQKAEELQPELILMDIGLPALNGIEAARQIRRISPKSKILFVSEHRSIDIAREAIRAGGYGYVVKSYAGKDLLPAITATAEGEHFASADLASHIFSDVGVEPAVEHGLHKDGAPTAAAISGDTDRTHEVVFFPNDESLIDGFARFAKTALENGNPVVVLATESHRAGILGRLRDDAVEVERAAERGLLIEADSPEVLSKFMENGAAVADRVMSIAERLVAQARSAAATEQFRIAVCGELAPTLLREGNPEAAMGVERHFDEIAKKHDLNVLCGYVLGTFRNDGSNRIVERICAEHSAVHMR
ncbi:MAG TPA: response regulator [Terriglobales bacterium]|nr:response regulator [Terriglobales bacterium]